MMSAPALAAILVGLPMLQPRQVAGAFPEGVSIDFRNGEDAHGLAFVDGFQCSRKVTDIDGVGCAQTTPPGGMYLLFETDRDMVVPDRDTLTFEVEVYDGFPSPFMLQVESNTPSLATGGDAFRVVSSIRRTGRPKWRQIRWQVTDPAFSDLERDTIRFRFYDEAWWNDGRLLSISQVRVTHEALVFRPQEDAVLCGDRLPVTVEGYDKAGRSLPDGTEVKLTYEPASALTERPQSVTLEGGETEFEVAAGPEPGTVQLRGLPEGGRAWTGLPIFVLAGQGPLEERTDLVDGEGMAATARFASRDLADSTVSTITDDQGQVVLRGTCVWKPEVTPGETRLILDVPIAGLPSHFCVYLGCLDQSVDGVWARVMDRTGELFSYHIEPRDDGHALERWVEACLDFRALAGPGFRETQGISDGIIDLPCALYSLDIIPTAGCREAEINVWGVEFDVLAPPLDDADNEQPQPPTFAEGASHVEPNEAINLRCSGMAGAQRPVCMSGWGADSGGGATPAPGRHDQGHRARPGRAARCQCGDRHYPPRGCGPDPRGLVQDEVRWNGGVPG